MTMMDVTTDVIYQRARETSEGEGIDEHWKSVLPEAIHCADNEIFLVLHRADINTLMERDAALFAQSLPPREIGNLADATLALHCHNRVWLLRMSKNPLFHTLVDQSYGIISNTRDAGRWVKPSLLWLPIPAGFHRQIYDSLVERYKHYFFAERCYAELIHRGRRNPYMKHTFIQLTDDPDLYHLRSEGSQWLHDASRRIAASVGASPEVGEDVKQDWLTELLPQPLHRQIQNAGATRMEIKHRAYDIQHRKGGQHKPTYLADEPNEPLDESTIEADDGIDVEALLQRLQSRRTKIQQVLSKGNPKIGKRRFKVLEMMAHTSCQKTIAKELKKSESTITRDIQIIKKARYRIQDILDI